MLDAKTNLSRLVEALESGAEQKIIIARNGKPAARLVPIGPGRDWPTHRHRQGQVRDTRPGPSIGG